MPGSPGIDVPGVSPPAVVSANRRGPLSLPRTGLTIALLLGAGLLLTGTGLATRRVTAARRSS